MLPELITAFFISLILQYFDASIGMGYGTMTPVLLFLGFSPLHVVPAVIISSAVLSMLAGIMHHGIKNVDFSIGKKHLKIVSILSAFGIAGIIIGASIAVRIPEKILSSYIGLMIIIIGAYIILKHDTKRKFSWLRIIGLGSLASFNKGMTGGGYGPVLAGGQIISGVKSKKAVGITAMTEGLVSLAGVAAYLTIINGTIIDIILPATLILGGTLSTPLAVHSTKKIPTKNLKLTIAIISIILGLFTLINALII